MPSDQDRNRFIESVLGWLHQGYPDGVPRTDYYPLLALLHRTLTEDEVNKKHQEIVASLVSLLKVTIR